MFTSSLKPNKVHIFSVSRVYVESSHDEIEIVMMRQKSCDAGLCCTN
jgi:hypothetical protein